MFRTGFPTSQLAERFHCFWWVRSRGPLKNFLLISFRKFCFAATSYHVSVKTGDKRGAGTDADVHIKVRSRPNRDTTMAGAADCSQRRWGSKWGLRKTPFLSFFQSNSRQYYFFSEGFNAFTDFMYFFRVGVVTVYI